MARLVLLGATGSLGRHVLQQALDAGHTVTAVVRNPDRLPAALRERVQVQKADLATASAEQLRDIVAGHDAFINTAGMVTDGQGFVDLVDKLVSAVEMIPQQARPSCWFLAGAGLMDVDARGRRGVDLPKVRTVYWPHRANFERLQRSTLDWRLLCPGPMVEQAAMGLNRMRVSIDRTPVHMPGLAQALPGALALPFFAYRVPEMIVPYGDAAALMLANLTPGGPMSGHRVGLALPLGMRGKKSQWTAAPSATA